ncbi:hypothetical protein ABK040_010860 [Willaertia magna]
MFNSRFDENVFGVPNTRTSFNNPAIVKTTKPSSTIAPNQQRTCLGDISNQVHLKQTNTQLYSKGLKPVTNAFPAKPVNYNTKTTSNVTAAPNTTSFNLPSSLQSKIQTNTVNDMCISPPPKKHNNTSVLSSPKIDERDSQDPQSCTAYIKEIVKHYKHIESKYMPNPNYMTAVQEDIQPHMRTILVDWLVDVHYKFRLLPETLYLCMNLMDRFLGEAKISRQKLQLVGVTSLFIASKYEEILCPLLSDFVKVTKEAYDKEELLRMERCILQTLDFNLTVVTPNVFLKRYIKCAKCNDIQTFIAYYASELALMEYKMLVFSPSTIACGAIYLARVFTQAQDKWDYVLQYYSEKTEEEVVPCARALLQIIKKYSTQKNEKPLIAVINKYKREARLKVAIYCAKRMNDILI